MTDDNVALMEVPTQNLGIAMTPEFAGQLAEALKKVHPLTLDGTNAFHHYDYPTVAQVRGNAGQALAQAGIGIIPEIQKCMRDSRVTGKGGTTNVTVVQLRMHLFSSKGSISVNWVGESEDLTDKGTAKAISAGVKSFLIAFLMMPFEEEENDDGKTDVELNKKRAKTQPDDISAIIAEARVLGVTFKVEGDSLRPINGNKMTPELSKKVSSNSERIVEYIKANAAPSVPTVQNNDEEPASSKMQPDEPPAVPEVPVETKGNPDKQTTTTLAQHTQNLGVATSTPQTQKLATNGKQAEKSSVQRPLSPSALRDFIHSKADSINKQGQKCSDRDRQQLAAAMDAAFTDKSQDDRKAKRHRVTTYLTGYESLSSNADNKMPDWYVLAIKAWLSFTYSEKKYVLPDFVVKEANAVEHEALMQEGGVAPLSPSADFAAECLTTNHTEEDVKKWLEGNGWDVMNDWEKCEPSAREFIIIARTQGVDLLTDETIREMVLARGVELWPVA